MEFLGKMECLQISFSFSFFFTEMSGLSLNYLPYHPGTARCFSPKLGQTCRVPFFGNFSPFVSDELKTVKRLYCSIRGKISLRFFHGIGKGSKWYWPPAPSPLDLWQSADFHPKTHTIFVIPEVITSHRPRNFCPLRACCFLTMRILNCFRSVI